MPTERNGSRRCDTYRPWTYAAAAKSHQLCPTLCDPIDGSLPGTSVHGIFQARVLEWGAIAFSKRSLIFPILLGKMLSCVQLLVTPWTAKKTEHQRIDAFKLWCWRRLLRVPWTARRSKQSILKKINPEYSLEGLMLKLKRHYFCHLMHTKNLLEKS